MPFILALIAAAGAAFFWLNRARDAGHAIGDIKDMADDVRLAARRFGFKRRTNVHPVDAIDDPRLAATGIVAAIAEMEQMMTADTLNTFQLQVQSVFDIDPQAAQEMVVFGRWIADQCGTRHEAVRRMSRHLMTLAGSETLPDLERMIAKVCGNLSENMDEAMEVARRNLS